jgi:hypothetical protein
MMRTVVARACRRFIGAQSAAAGRLPLAQPLRVPCRLLSEGADPSRAAVPRARRTATSTAFRKAGGMKTVMAVLALGGFGYIAYYMQQEDRSWDTLLGDLKRMLASSLDEHRDPRP